MVHRLFAIGDIHGCFDAFYRLVETINLNKNDRLVLLGDYIDRGTNSKEVIDYIISLQEHGFDIVPLMGNHESLLLESINNDQQKSNWIFNGGMETLKSFQINSIDEINCKYLDFFSGLASFHLFEDYLFVHAGFNDNCQNPFEDIYSMIWKNQPSYSHPLLKEKTIIHGHRPITIEKCRQQIEEKRKVINIDTGCIYNNKYGLGKLTALELFANELFWI